MTCKHLRLFFGLAGALIAWPSTSLWARQSIHLDDTKQQATLRDGTGQLVLRLNYDRRCILDHVFVRGREVVGASGVCTGIRDEGHWFTTENIPTPHVTVRKDTLTVTGIGFGRPGAKVHETWKFIVKPDAIVWQIKRKYATKATVEDGAFPEWNFRNISTWTGGMLDDGGVVWDKYLDAPNATYGAHFGTVTFWNSESNDCLRIIPELPRDQFGAGRFSRQNDGAFSFDYVVSGQELQPKHGLRRFLRNRQDLWSPFSVKPSEVSGQFTLKAFDYAGAYNRGIFSGLNGDRVRDLLNTVARYGVIDRGLTGGNGWRSGYICLHEPFFAEIGLALDEEDYTANFSRCLNYERDHAIRADGRVESRWAYDAGDSMPGSYNRFGFYEAQWGWLMDSQPDYVINVAEQFNLTGDRQWLAGEKTACEKALSFLMRREVSNTGLTAMMNDSIREQTSSDWIDVIWASYENAFVNAQLYYALELWADDEDTLKDPTAATGYRNFAARLKETFNRPITDGGFWDPTNQWYVYWRDKDGSIHGDNLVTPVNFAAIAYGICDDASRRKAVLDRIETEMSKEKLFSWPLNFFPYQLDEGGPGNFPFPKYENGDIFLSWNELGVRAYAGYKPAIALKYVRNILNRYGEDGLSFQRYLRQSQQGAGDDILAGNCMAIVGLYRDIYGIQPKPDRLYLDPHLAAELDGTKLCYQLRGRPYLVDLDTNDYSITVGSCTVSAASPFAVNATDHGLEYFSGANANWSLAVSQPKNQSLTVWIDSWPGASGAPHQWRQTTSGARGKIHYSFAQLEPRGRYELKINGQTREILRADNVGRVHFTCISDNVRPQEIGLFPASAKVEEIN